MAKSRPPVNIRRWKEEDIPAIVACHRDVYRDYPSRTLYQERDYHLQFAAFPDGQFLAESGGQVVGYATSVIVQLADDVERYRYDEITGSGTFSTHTGSGDTLYGADIAVRADFRGRGIARRLYDRRQRLVRRLNLRRMVAYGRLPGFQEWSGRMTADEYVREVTEGRIRDPALAAHLSAGYEVRGILLDFMSDSASLNHATLLEWLNPDFDAQKRRIAAPPITRPTRRIRVCAAQYFMRRIDTWAEFEQTVEFFVDTAHAYHSHFLLLPELFTAQLLYTFQNTTDFDAAVHRLTEYTDQYVSMFIRFATSYKLYIIAGSTPTLRDGELYNVCHIFTPTGAHYTQDKLHITPGERHDWGVRAGNGIQVFNTPLARIAVQVCYDIEFPEVSRLLTMHGAEVIFVPFSTDEKQAFNRVRCTAQARAIENWIYVVTAGNAGNLPTIKNYLINYAQSAVYTPSDFAFPMDGVAARADPNTETVVVADLDLTSLEMQREMGSVRPFFDRRGDLYNITTRDPVSIVRIE